MIALPQRRISHRCCSSCNGKYSHRIGTVICGRRRDCDARARPELFKQLSPVHTMAQFKGLPRLATACGHT